jgi:hypothetical protein
MSAKTGTRAATRRVALGYVLLAVAVVVGVTVTTSSPNGQTILAMGIAILGGWLVAIGTMRGGR